MLPPGRAFVRTTARKPPRDPRRPESGDQALLVDLPDGHPRDGHLLAVEAQVGDFGLGDGVRLDRPLLPQVMTNPPQLAEERFVARHNRFATFERFAVPHHEPRIR